jgi:hypothetical protein
LLEDIEGPAQVIGEGQAHECSEASSQKAKNYSQVNSFISVTPAGGGDGETTQGA